MTLRQFKRVVFLIEGFHGLAVAYYFNYVFFYLQKEFGFGNVGNLTFSAVNGFVYMISAIFGGRFAQRYGYYRALNVGFIIMTIALLAGYFWKTVPGQFSIMILWTFGMCFTWPTLEALTSEGENSKTLPPILGIYNVVWAGAAALALFFGGAFFEHLGRKSIFWLPILLHLAMVGVVLWLKKQLPHGIKSVKPEKTAGTVEITHHPETSPVIAKSFLRMAWLANPFAYIAINTVVPLIPSVAERLHLSPKFAGFFCSVWMFSRLGTFVLLGLWTKWHYRFRWLLASYLLLIVTFAGLLLLSNVVLLVLIQILLGAAVGLIYYSSLFYSMDASDTKSEHGGLHEAAIGAGIFGGPTIGVTALYFFSTSPNSSVYAVSGMLLLGLGGLLALRKK